MEFREKSAESNYSAIRARVGRTEGTPVRATAVHLLPTLFQNAVDGCDKLLPLRTPNCQMALTLAEIAEKPIEICSNPWKLYDSVESIHWAETAKIPGNFVI